MEDSRRYKKYQLQESSLSNSRSNQRGGLNNQYSILNHGYDPYYMFDPLSYELNQSSVRQNDR